jgi:CheY-like chemotaxis protein
LNRRSYHLILQLCWIVAGAASRLSPGDRGQITFASLAIKFVRLAIISGKNHYRASNALKRKAELQCTPKVTKMVVSRKLKGKVILVDDHPGSLAAAREIIEDEFDVLAALTDGDSALDAISIFNPDIVVMDIGMSGKDGFEIARQVKERSWKTRVVFLTVMDDVDHARAARDMGASYVVKRRMGTDLLTAARGAMEGNLFFSPLLPAETRLR